MSSTAVEPWSLRATLCLFAAVLLGATLEISNGTQHPRAMAFMTVIVVAAAAATFVGEQALRGFWSYAPVLIAVVALASYFGNHVTHPPGVYLRGGGGIYAEHHEYIAVAAVLCGAALAATGRALHFIVAGLLIVYALLGLWLLKASPAPHIDVWIWHNAAYEALAQGQSPYAITIPNIYGHTRWYAEGLATPAQVLVGYPYPPLTLLSGWVGHLLAGDYRYLQLFAQLATGALVYASRPSRMSALAAALFLFTPRGLFVLEQGWTEPLSALSLAATLFCALRFPGALPYAFGVMVGIKQYFIFAIPLLPLLLGTRDWKVLLKFLVKAAIVPALLTLPFVLWNFDAFIASAITFQGKQPYREDALSVMSWLPLHGGPMLPLNISFVFAFGAVGLALWRNRKTPAGFTAALAFSFLLFFWFAKQAFTNYYYLALAALVCAAAVASTDQSRRESTTGGPGASR